MSIKVNPPVLRICLVGPTREGKRLARQLYAICAERQQVPAFYTARSLTKGLMRRLYSRLCRTGLIAFGPQSGEVYETILRDHGWIKVLRLLESGVPEPELSFDYQGQTWTADTPLEVIVSWMGITSGPNSEPFYQTMSGALSREELCPEEAGGPTPAESEGSH